MLGVELIMLRMMGRCLTLILLSSAVVLITAGKYTDKTKLRKGDGELLHSGIGHKVVGIFYLLQDV